MTFQPQPRSYWRGFVVVCASAMAVLLAGLQRVGIWTEVELHRIDLSRRIAYRVFGREDALIAGANNRLPTLTDLAAGELPSTSIAAAFAVAGAGEVPARLVLAGWALVAVLATYVGVAKLRSVRAAMVASVVLVSTPMFFVQARIVVGDIVTVAGVALATFGAALTIRAMSPEPWLADRADRRDAMTGATMLVLGLMVGFLSRGVLFGVGMPAMVAATYCGGANRTRRNVVVAAALSLAVVAIAIGVADLSVQAGADVARTVGFAPWPAAPRASTFDGLARRLGHGALPWVVFLPAGATITLSYPKRAFTVFAWSALIICYAFQVWLEPYSGPLVFFGLPFLACVVADSVETMVERRRGHWPVAVSMLVVAAILLHDFDASPGDAASAAFGGAYIPDPSEQVVLPGLALYRRAVATAVLVLAAGCCLDPKAVPAGPFRFLIWCRARVIKLRDGASLLLDACDGRLSLAALVGEGLLLGMALLVFLAPHLQFRGVLGWPHWLLNALAMAWWVTPLTVILAVVTREVVWVILMGVAARFRISLVGILALVSLPFAAFVSIAFAGAVAQHEAPGAIFAEFRRNRQPPDRIGLFRVPEQAARYELPGQRVALFGPGSEPVRWLARGSAKQRRWLAFASSELPQLNREMRMLGLGNLAVAAGHRGGMLLGAVPPLTPDGGPLRGVVLDAPPADIQFPVAAMIDRRVEVLGWSTRGPQSKKGAILFAGHVASLVLYARAVGASDENAQWFVHIVGHGTKHNVTQPVAGGRYPLPYWLVGDVVATEVAVDVPPDMTPGTYTMFIGLFTEHKRLTVTSGPHNKNRVIAGTLTIR